MSNAIPRLIAFILLVYINVMLFSGCCFVTYYTRRAALEAQNALHNVKTLPGVSIENQLLIPISDTWVPKFNEAQKCIQRFYLEDNLLRCAQTRG